MMGIVDQHEIDHPGIHVALLRLQQSVMKAVESGRLNIIWKNMTVESCRQHELIATELEYYDAAIYFRDNVSKCPDFKEKVA